MVKDFGIHCNTFSGEEIIVCTTTIAFARIDDDVTLTSIAPDYPYLSINARIITTLRFCTGAFDQTTSLPDFYPDTNRCLQQFKN